MEPGNIRAVRQVRVCQHKACSSMSLFSSATKPSDQGKESVLLLVVWGTTFESPMRGIVLFLGMHPGKTFLQKGTSSNYFKKQGRVYEKLLFKKRTLILNSLNPTPQISERIHFLWEWINLANTLPVNLAKRSNQSIWRIFLRGVKVATQQKQSIWQIY